jgi:phosphinothricin acetyltransferase
MQALEDHARARSVHAMIAGISSANPDAMRFHARLGYVEVGVLPETGRKFGRWYDLHLMQKRL